MVENLEGLQRCLHLLISEKSQRNVVLDKFFWDASLPQSSGNILNLHLKRLKDLLITWHVSKYSKNILNQTAFFIIPTPA